MEGHVAGFKTPTLSPKRLEPSTLNPLAEWPIVGGVQKVEHQTDLSLSGAGRAYRKKNWKRVRVRSFGRLLGGFRPIVGIGFGFL